MNFNAAMFTTLLIPEFKKGDKFEVKIHILSLFDFSLLIISRNSPTAGDKTGLSQPPQRPSTIRRFGHKPGYNKILYCLT